MTITPTATTAIRATTMTSTTLRTYPIARNLDRLSHASCGPPWSNYVFGRGSRSSGQPGRLGQHCRRHVYGRTIALDE